MRDQKRYSHLWPWLLLLPPLRRQSALDHQAPAPAPAPTAAVRLVASASEAAKEETPVRFHNLHSAVEHLFSFKLEDSASSGFQLFSLELRNGATLDIDAVAGGTPKQFVYPRATFF
jgi:hypothetical protein